jgi:hypothetical protein
MYMLQQLVHLMSPTNILHAFIQTMQDFGNFHTCLAPIPMIKLYMNMINFQFFFKYSVALIYLR